MLARPVHLDTPSGAETSAWTVNTRDASPQAAATSAAASASRAAVRAHRVTQQPSRASAVALARPSPRLEPVMMAILSVSWRSMEDSGFALRLAATAARSGQARLRSAGPGF